MAMTTHPNRNPDLFARLVNIVTAAERAHAHAIRRLRAAERAEKTAATRAEGAGWVNQDEKPAYRDATQALETAAKEAAVCCALLGASHTALAAIRAAAAQQ